MLATLAEMETTPPNFVAAALGALDRLGEMARQRSDTADVLARWSPVAMAVQKLGFTLFAVGNHLYAVSKADEVELIPDELAQELRADLAQIAATFPGIDEVIFGTDAIDEFIDSATSNLDVRRAFVAAGGQLAGQFEKLLDRLVTMAMDPDSSDASTTDLARYFEQVERVLDKALDRWLREVVR